MSIKARVGDTFLQDRATFETCGIDITEDGDWDNSHSHQIEVYGNRALRDVLVELINQNAEIVELALK